MGSKSRLRFVGDDGSERHSQVLRKNYSLILGKSSVECDGSRGIIQSSSPSSTPTTSSSDSGQLGQ